MKIIFLCNEYPPAPHGGIGIFVKGLGEALIKFGHQVLVIGFDDAIDNNRVDNVNGVEVHRYVNKFRRSKKIRIGKYHLSFHMFKSRMFISRELKIIADKFQPDLIESYDWSGPLWSKPKWNLVVRMHGAHTAYQYYEGKKTRGLLHYFEKRNLLMADYICSVSSHIGEITMNAFGLNRNYETIYNSVDINKFRKLETVVPNKNKLLYVGRIHPRKGLFELMTILDLLFENNRNLHIDLIGPSNKKMEKNLLASVKTKNRERINFIGTVPHEDLVKKFNECLLFIMPSRAEAFGLTCIEAMACETPVFMTNRATGTEIISDTENGFLFDINDPDETSKKLQMIVDNDTELIKIGRNGRKNVVDRFSNEVIIQKNIEFYNAINA